jgi:hypothetical protein
LSSHAAVDKVQPTQAMPAVACKLSHIQTLPNACADGMKRGDTPTMFHVVQESSVVALASGRVDSEAAKFVVDKFTCLLH